MKRRALLLSLLLLVPACSGGDDEAGSSTTVDTRQPNQQREGITKQGGELETVAEGKFTACVDVPKPPFAVEEEGRIAGVDPELLRGLTGRLGLQAEFRDVEPTALFTELDAGRCDVVASAVSATAAEATARLASEPYLDVTQALLVRAGDAARYTDLPALQGKPVGVQSGSAAVALARGSGATVTEMRDIAQLVIALMGNRIEAVVHEYPVLAAVAAAEPTRTVTKRFTDVTDRYVFVFPKAATATKAALDEALRTIRRDDTYNTVMRRYLGGSATP